MLSGLLEQFANVGLHLLHLGRCEVSTRVRDRVHTSEWVLESHIGEKLVVGKFKQRLVEFQECSHNFVVDVERQALVKLVGLHPGDGHSHDLNAVVNTFDRQEGLCEALAHRAVQHKVRI